jgi:hypothetical protein
MALSSEIRSALEKAIVAARDAAEEASAAALGVLSVDADRAPEALDEEKRRLRVALRAEARQLGGFERLVEESAYEQWHRMLFARVLSENDLLIHPKHGVPVTLDDCEEIAHARSESDLWLVASEFASTMLPGIFRSDDPVLQVTLAPEGQQRLEEILAGLPREIFTSEDGLGWVYQYWQAKKKKEVNASERKIGGADIAPVTQLFTENYMVRFLLENTLGAWWASRHPDSPLVREWEYLRFDEGKPAAGSFPGWPVTVGEVTVMDPCCGSGHFLVVAFEMLRKMQMESEGLSAADAGDAVLRDNLFGLELDPRCTQIAAFALALQAWKTGGYRELPIPNIACSGISAKGRLEDWKNLARGDERLERSLERLHGLFSDAGDLGSLIDPLGETDGDLLVATFGELVPLLQRALATEAPADPSAAVFGSAAAGAARAAALLGRRYVLVTTNPPFLGIRKQGPTLRAFCGRRHQDAKAELATVFLQRNLRFAQVNGSVSMVTPQHWFSLQSYTGLRKEALTTSRWDCLALLGSGAFEAISGAVVNVALFTASQEHPDKDHVIPALDGNDAEGARGKARLLRDGELLLVSQRRQLSHPDARVVLEVVDYRHTLGKYADCLAGIMNGDSPRFQRLFWERPDKGTEWAFQQTTVRATTPFGGRHLLIYFDEEAGHLRESAEFRRKRLHNSDQRGNAAWGRSGVAVSQMSALPVSLYTGEKFDSNIAVVLPKEPEYLAALWTFCQSSSFAAEVRRLDRKMNITNATIGKVPFDFEEWDAQARSAYPSGLPSPFSSQSTEWLFTGHPQGSDEPLQVGVARLLGYRWPRQTGSAFTSCPALGPDGLERFADEDGIVCIPSVRGERPAAERLRGLLAAAFGREWSPAKEADLLAEVGYAGKSLEHWLRDGFFSQHCQLFHQRPFIWHVWDGRKDGFSALLNYHQLDRAQLEKLVFTYLGDWIRQQRDSAAGGTPGADLRLAAGSDLRAKLELILEGEPPYDLFVRWKPIEQQPMGWEPALDDGIRINTRPFATASVLRRTPKIRWGKDSGKDDEGTPWYPVFKGDRINDHHLTLAEKRAAREAAERRAAAS